MGYFAIKRARRELIELETLGAQAELGMIRAEKKIVALQPEEYRETIWNEFKIEHALHNMMFRMGLIHEGRSTQEIIDHGTLLAKLYNKKEKK